VSHGPEVHQRRSLRLAGYDYRWPGTYFVTVCAHGHRYLFGEIIEGAMHPNALGELVETCWQEIPAHIAATRLDAFALMPNHLHGIVVIECRGKACLAPTLDGPGAPSEPTYPPRGVPSRSLGAIVGAFKSSVTRQARQQGLIGAEALWQRGYYEHIIRSDREWEEIARYTTSNPALWADARLQPPTAFGDAAQASGRPVLNWRPA